MPQIVQFAIQESIIKTVESAVEAYGLESLPGSDGEVTVHEDVAGMSKGYQVGDPLPFTATLNAAAAKAVTVSTTADASSSSGAESEKASEE